jgi:hypothetical protein
MSCLQHNYVSTFSNALIQGAIVFAFLTIFFFGYVTSVEKDEYSKQVGMVVDNIYEQYKEDIEKVLPKNEESRKLTKAAIYGIIDTNEEYLSKSTEGERKELDDSNSKIIKNSVLSVLILLIICVSLLIIFAFFGYCIPLKDFVKEGFFILLFIFIVEFLFLNIIAKNYISANPNTVKKELAQSVINYVNNRNK